MRQKVRQLETRDPAWRETARRKAKPLWLWIDEISHQRTSLGDVCAYATLQGGDPNDDPERSPTRRANPDDCQDRTCGNRAITVVLPLEASAPRPAVPPVARPGGHA